MEKTGPLLFLFDQDRDLDRAKLIQNSWSSFGGHSIGICTVPEWESICSQGESGLFRYYDQLIEKASFVAVLIGKETSTRHYLRYAVQQSHQRSKPIVGIYIHRIKGPDGNVDKIGNTHFGELGSEKGKSLFFWQRYPIYRWVIEDGDKNILGWIKQAYFKASVSLDAAQVQDSTS